MVIVVDTLRLDRSSQLAKTLKGSVDYGWAVTPAPWTLPAHVSLLTGLYASIHETHESADVKSLQELQSVRNDKTTLMTRLKALGYTTYGFSANNFISRTLGFTGFDVLKNWDMPLNKLLFKMDPAASQRKRIGAAQRLKIALRSLLYNLKTHPRAVSKAAYSSISYSLRRRLLKWPEDKGLSDVINFVKHTEFKEPFFLFLNILEVHDPYYKNDQLIGGGFGCRATSTITKEELSLSINGYDNQVKRVAKKLPKLFGALERKGQFNNTLVILTSDHGQLLGEHGWIGHGIFLYDELVKVPLTIKYPLNMKQFNSSGGYISLASIPNFVLDMAEGRNTDKSLYSDQVFSESWFSLPKTMGESNFKDFSQIYYAD